MLFPVAVVQHLLPGLPGCWKIFDAACCEGLHDEPDTASCNPHFRHGFIHAHGAIVAHDDGCRFALTMQHNAAEAVPLPHRPFGERLSFEQCIGCAGAIGTLAHWRCRALPLGICP